jgi:hypothetical protein
MNEESAVAPSQAPVYERPSFEVISLDCEITAYAPDGNDPLF